jgi:hypothetical protein
VIRRKPQDESSVQRAVVNVFRAPAGTSLSSRKHPLPSTGQPRAQARTPDRCATLSASRASRSSRMRRKRIHVSSGTSWRARAQFDRRMMSQMDLTAALADCCEASRLLLLEEADLLLALSGCLRGTFDRLEDRPGEVQPPPRAACDLFQDALQFQYPDGLARRRVGHLQHLLRPGDTHVRVQE